MSLLGGVTRFVSVIGCNAALAPAVVSSGMEQANTKEGEAPCWEAWWAAVERCAELEAELAKVTAERDEVTAERDEARSCAAEMRGSVWHMFTAGEMRRVLRQSAPVPYDPTEESSR